jgi:hypothetical protein
MSYAHWGGDALEISFMYHGLAKVKLFWLYRDTGGEAFPRFWLPVVDAATASREAESPSLLSNPNAGNIPLAVLPTTTVLPSPHQPAYAALPGATNADKIRPFSPGLFQNGYSIFS